MYPHLARPGLDDGLPHHLGGLLSLSAAPAWCYVSPVCRGALVCSCLLCLTGVPSLHSHKQGKERSTNSGLHVEGPLSSLVLESAAAKPMPNWASAVPILLSESTACQGVGGQRTAPWSGILSDTIEENYLPGKHYSYRGRYTLPSSIVRTSLQEC